MHKFGLLPLILSGATFAMVGCESTQSTDTAQSTPQVQQSEAGLAQSANIETETQAGAAVQVDPTLQQAEPIQVSPASDEMQNTPAQ